ncbi:MAG: hypothetical protein ACW99U_20100 [Candidatus Thorarchaeota archaeon]|jgi:hypothetical protein
MQPDTDLLQKLIGNVPLIPLVVGLMELAKTQFGLKGKSLAVTAIVSLFVVGVLFSAYEQALIPEAIIPWIKTIFEGAAFVLMGASAMGLHEWTKKFRAKAES